MIDVICYALAAATGLLSVVNLALFASGHGTPLNLASALVSIVVSIHVYATTRRRRAWRRR